MPLDADTREERSLWLRLTLTPGIGPAGARRLLEAFGLPEEIFAAGRARIGAALDPRLASALLSDDEERDAQIDAALDWAGGEHNHLIALCDPAYPKALLQISDPPPLLYVLGALEALAGDLFAIVGSRHATPGGAANARDFARALADEGLTICSGLARGIDAAAHRGGLEGRAGTVAVIGTGIDRVYPPANRPLAREIAAHGAIVSEFALGTGVQRANFPRRNRVIAGLSLGVLVVEAAPHSGSLITARHAAEYGREVMAVPGSIHSPVARGCHRLIREGAKLVESADDVLAELRGQMRQSTVSTHQPTDPQTSVARRDARQTPSAGDCSGPTAPPLGGKAQRVLATLDWDPADPDTMVARSALPAGEVAAALLELELAGLVERWNDGRYVRAPGADAGRR